MSANGRDGSLIRLNLYGLRSPSYGGRARLHLTLIDDEEAHEWRLILPTGQENSPFELRDGELCDDGLPIGTACEVEHDDAKLGYFRNGLKSVTLNTNRRSLCTGCVFCPNTGLEGNDPVLTDLERYLSAWVDSTLTSHRLASLSGVTDVTLSTGCFGEEDAAVRHMGHVRRILSTYGFRGRLGILSSVIRTRSGFNALNDSAGPAAVILTLECVNRRALILKRTKADLSVIDAVEVLDNGRLAGVDTGVTLVVGLDSIEAVTEWLRRAASTLTMFPNLQIFQAHGPFMAAFRHPGAETHEFFLKARRSFEDVLKQYPTRPDLWSNYRPLWYYEYAGQPVV